MASPTSLKLPASIGRAFIKHFQRAGNQGSEPSWMFCPRWAVESGWSRTREQDAKQRDLAKDGRSDAWGCVRGRISSVRSIGGQVLSGCCRNPSPSSKYHPSNQSVLNKPQTAKANCRKK